jgi:hypothetical protein
MTLQIVNDDPDSVDQPFQIVLSNLIGFKDPIENFQSMAISLCLFGNVEDHLFFSSDNLSQADPKMCVGI